MRIKRVKGITLIEALVYLVLFGMIFITVFEFFFSTSESNDHAKAQSDIDKTAIFLSEHLRTSEQATTEIAQENCVFDIPAGVLRLNTASGYVEYSVANGRFLVSREGNPAYLTRPGIVVNSFTIKEILNRKDELSGVKIELVISSPKFKNVKKTIETILLP